MGSYDVWQQVFCMSNTVNALFTYQTSDATEQSGYSVDLSQTLAGLVDQTLSDPNNTPYIGSWKRVWGPVVWQAENSTTVDNAMMVVSTADDSLIVVAIAGTMYHSAYDKQTEDFDLTRSGWPNNENSAIAEGTAIGLGVLEGMCYDQDEGVCPDCTCGQTVGVYLQSVESTDTTLVLTGHSLGGALVMPLALGLATLGDKPLDIGKWQAVHVYPTAAPTPGDSGFNELFSGTFAAQTGLGDGHAYQAWNAVVWNTLDAIPHAWTLDAQSEKETLPYLDQITLLYKQQNQTDYPKDAVATLVDGFKADSLASTVKFQFTDANAAFDGTLSSTVTDIDSFWTEVLYQHIQGYIDAFSISEFTVAQPSNGVGIVPLKPGLPVLAVGGRRSL